MRAVMPCGWTSTSAPICWRALDVEVDRPAPDAVAADQRHERLVGPVEQRAEQQDRDAVEAGELERHPRRAAPACGTTVIEPPSMSTSRPIERRMSAVMPTSPTAGALVIVDGRVGHQGGDHVLGDRVLGTRHPDVAPQGSAGLDVPGRAPGSVATAGVGASMDRAGYSRPPGR